MRSTLLLVAATMLLASFPQAAACQPTTSPANCINAGSMCLYVVQDDCGTGCVSVWIYMESNHILGLQRFDTARDDTCNGIVDSDMRIL